MKFHNIQQYVESGSYQVCQPLTSIKQRIDEWIEEDGMEMNPDFQRGHVWTEEQQIKWMEYLLQGGASGRVLYFNAPWWGDFDKRRYPYKDFVLVDGLQRLTAILRFINNEIAIFGGHYIEDFEDRLRMARAEMNLLININNLKTKADVLTWYIQMNDGGTPHTEEEIEKVRNLLIEEES